MAFRINDFKANLAGEGARPTLFDAQINFPNGGASDRNFVFTCRAAQLPGKTFGVIEVPYFGRKLKIAGDQTFAEWTVTVINDESFITRNAFEKWMSGINEHNGNIRTNPAYTANAVVKQYTKDGGVAKTYNFIGMFPSDLAPIDVSWDANDTLEEYTVTLQYQWWESVNTTDLA
jgi:hypothetical protein